LQREEVLVGLQVRIALRDRQQLAQASGELVLRVRLRLHRGRLHSAGPGPGDLLEDLALVRGVSLDRLHEVRDQVVAAPELDVDLRPGVVDAVPRPDEPVEGIDRVEDGYEEEPEDDPEPEHGLMVATPLPAAGARPRTSPGSGRRHPSRRTTTPSPARTRRAAPRGRGPPAPWRPPPRGGGALRAARGGRPRRRRR